ncbi:hypothetical protein AGMMS50268_37810 [Spirochaetia bacterium]|nr:hypothetical protein AGMMS50268_37810 [Spirochaetia bacterium]
MKLNGIVDAYLSQALFGAGTRGFYGLTVKQAAKNFFIFTARTYSLFPLFFGIFFIIKNHKEYSKKKWEKRINPGGKNKKDFCGLVNN